MRTGVRNGGLAVAAATLLTFVAWHASAEDAVPFASVQDAAAALDEAQAQLAEARKRGKVLEDQAQAATEAAERTEREAAAVAARIQESQAQAAIDRAQLALLDKQQVSLRLEMAARQAPLVRLTAALEVLARRPPVFGLLRPGSLRDTVYLRALLTTMAPAVEQRTAGLRSAIDKARALQRQQAATIESLRTGSQVLAERQKRLAGLLAQQKIASIQAQGNAVRETDRALALAEQTRDLGGLMERLDSENALRDALAALPGPVLRPANPRGVVTSPVSEAAAAEKPVTGSIEWVLPVVGQLASSFGTRGETGVSRGISLLPQPGAVVVAPARGRVAFAGPYRGYGRIVIIEHDGGWATLITGLARVDRAVGETLLQGAPIGAAEATRPVVTVELRKDGLPVNPLSLVR